MWDLEAVGVRVNESTGETVEKGSCGYDAVVCGGLVSSQVWLMYTKCIYIDILYV